MVEECKKKHKIYYCEKIIFIKLTKTNFLIKNDLIFY